ncbi:MAG: DNA polymerase, partial [Alphaproteobacteria bacterium]|nr:DNA polymerase [Alphaproteobacteria bacterium]
PSSALPTLPLKEGETKHLPYKLITTEPELDEFIAGIGDVLAIDTETTGLDQMTARAVGISLATSPHHGVYIPLRHTKKSESLFDDDSASHVQLDINIVREKLWPILKNKNIIKVGHNLKYDFHVLENEGWATDEIAPYDDTMLLSYVLFGTSHGHGLDELAEIYLAHDTIKFGALFPPKMKDADKNFAHIDLQSAAEYAAEDAWITFALYKKFREKLEHNETLHKLYENCDRPLMRVLLHMERIGVMADQSRLASLSEIFHKQLATLQKEIWHLAGREFNIASPKQLGELLYDELKLPGGGKSKSTDAATLAEISSEHPVVAKVLEWRSVAKLAGTYADALPRQIASDGRIHTTYLQTSTNTGRLSSRDPNLQNIPIKSELGMEIRKCFVAPRGRTLIALDYSQIQLRLLAHFADVKELKESFAHGRDIHEDTARKIYGIAPGGHVTHAQRAVAKTTNFSIIYGVSPFGLAAQLDIPVGDAKQLIDSYMAGFPEIETYMKNTKEFGAAHGYVMTPWGRRIELPDVKNPRSRSYALRAAINAPIQGFEADLMRFAMVKIDEMIRGEQIKMILQVHDEIVFECDEDSAEDWAQKIEHVMESVTKLSVPIVADYSISKDWKK